MAQEQTPSPKQTSTNLDDSPRATLTEKRAGDLSLTSQAEQQLVRKVHAAEYPA